MKMFENYHNIHLYIEPLDDSKPDAHIRYEVSNLLMLLEDYLNLTTNQYIRVKDNRDKLKNYPQNNKALHRQMNIFFGDIHFMLISTEKAYNLSIRLLKILGENKTAVDATKSQLFKIIKFIRNNLEHMDDKLTKEDGKYTEPWYSNTAHTFWFNRQWGSMDNDTIKLGDKSLTINGQTFEPLEKLYDIILSIITKRYVIPNKEIVDRIFSRHIKKWE